MISNIECTFSNKVTVRTCNFTKKGYHWRRLPTIFEILQNTVKKILTMEISSKINYQTIITIAVTKLYYKLTYRNGYRMVH